MAMTFEEMAAQLDPATIAWIEARAQAQANMEEDLVKVLNKHLRLIFDANKCSGQKSEVVKDITDVIASIAINFLDVTAPKGYPQEKVYADAANIMAAACINIGVSRMKVSDSETRQ
jgi:hypothetical protein